MKVKRFRAFHDNYIWGIQSDSFITIVDPGESKPIIDYLNKNTTADLASILVTHHHADHVGGIKNLIAYSNSTPDDKKHFNINDTVTDEIPIIGPYGFEKYGVNFPVRGGDSFSIGRNKFSVLDIPGHTSSHIGYICKDISGKNVSLFCGDTMFAAGCGRILGGTAEELFDSILKIADLPDNTLIYCAHEYSLNNIQFAANQFPDDINIKRRRKNIEMLTKEKKATVPFRLIDEKLTNPFLRCKDINEFVKMRKAKDIW